MDPDDEERFGAWAQAQAGRLHRTAFLLCGDWHQAHDLVQEALVRTAQRWSRIERMDHPDAYVRRILVHLAYSRRRLRSAGETPVTALPEHPIDDGAAARAVCADLLDAVRRLPPRQRATVVLRFFEEQSEAETAAVLGCSVGTVKSQTAKALAALRRATWADDEPAPATPMTAATTKEAR